MNFQLLQQKSVRTLEEFRQTALEFSHKFTARTVVALSGSLGVGKTELVRTVAKARGFQDMASPTFAIHHRYQGFALNIDHLDLYRLENEDELETTGFWDFFAENEGLIFIEWPERMDLSHIPFDWDLFQIEIQLNQDGSRSMSLFERE